MSEARINLLRKTKKKKAVVSDEEADSGSSEEELDLTKECHPIAHYIDDRAEMINQMFSVIKGNKLKAMLPPILKDIDPEQLKLQCLDQLLGMSEKRITCLLEGEILDSSSESDDASEVSQSDEDSHSDKSSQMSDRESTNRKHKSKKRKSDTESVGKSSKLVRTGEDAPVPEQGKTLLEILELEMRARAIRALLNQGGETTNPDGAKDVAYDQPTISGVVDLTEDDDEFPTMIKQEPASEQELTFDEKVEKSKAGQKTKGVVVVAANKQKLIAETELRNKLNKKKTYRTRKQRLENVEEEETAKEKESVAVVAVKEEPPEENNEIVIEDPEEGEVSTEEEEEVPVPVKEEKPDSPPPVEEEKEKAMDGERIEAIDDGNFVVNENVAYHGENEERIETQSVEELDYSEDKSVSAEAADSPKTVEEDKSASVEAIDTPKTVEEDSQEPVPDQENSKDGPEDSQGPKEDDLEDTSWRGRWLQNEQVQKVVKSSKICGKVKKNIAKKKVMPVKEVAAPEIVNTDSNSALMEGSVDEYRLLKGKELAGNEEIAATEESAEAVTSLEEKDVVSTTIDEAEETLNT